MSIRLRLTLLYSGILALTLITFSGILYVTQAQTTLHEAKKELAGRAEYQIAKSPWHLGSNRDSTPRNDSSRIGSVAQVRSLAGDVLYSSPNLGETFILPLSDETLAEAQYGDKNVEVNTVGDERLLIYSKPYTSDDGRPLIMQVAMSLEDRDQNLATLGRILMIGSGGAVLAAFGIGWLLAGLALRPINRLRQTAQTIGTERDFGRRVEYAGPNDEIGKLVTTFNNMLTELQAAFLQVEETLQTQRRFVADASHELRTPLTTLRGNIGLLQRIPPIRKEDQSDVLGDMVDETERLMRLVNELLVLARADSGRPLQQEPVPIKPLLEDVYHQVKLLAPQRTINFHPDHDVTVIGNSDAMKQVLLVLLDNAVKHTPPETTVTLSTAQHNGQVAIHISDDGPGIASTHLPNIFDRFYRGDAARTSPGTGLGLAIASELTEAQHGTITVQSEVGRGSTFTLMFPKG